MLDPNHNLFSVAPVGNSVVIGRHSALKAGLERDRVLNLIGWLVIASGAKPEEIHAVIAVANAAKEVQGPKQGEETKDVVAPRSAASVVAGEAARPFIGDVDPQEKAAIDAAVAKAKNDLETMGAGTTAINIDELANAWNHN